MPPSLSGIGLKAGLLVWRIENFELSAVDEAHHGQFYTGDSYVLLRTTTSTSSSTVNDLYVWQGEDSSQDERGASAIQSVSVSRAVAASGGVHCTLRRELQGKESDAFKAVFKGAAAGLIYLQGGVKSGFHHVEGADAAHEPSLLHVKGRRSVVTRQVPVSAKSLNDGDCFILDLFSTLYLWTGVKANTVEKAKAVEVMTRLYNSRGAHCERIVLTSADSLRHEQFWAALGGSESDVQPSLENDDAKADDSEQPRLFSIDAQGCASLLTTDRLTKAVLLNASSNSKVIIVDGGADVYAWVSHAASNTERHSAHEMADKYIETHRKGSVPRVIVIHQGGETPLFEGLFTEWDAPPSFNFAEKASTGVAHGAAAVSIDYEKLLKNEAAKAASVETISLKSWAVAGRSVSEIPANAAGEFFSGDCVVVEHKFIPSGSKGSGSTIVYFWIGRSSSHIEQGHAALTAVELTDRAKKEGQQAHQMRVIQGSEPPSFVSAFSGLLIIHQGDRDAVKSAASRLYHIKGVSSTNVRAVQVAPKASSLNSGDAFVLLSDSGNEWCWSGSSCSAEERTAALKLAARLSTGTMVEVNEGFEDETFWKLLDGKTAYAKSVPSLPEGRAPRLFEVSDQGGSGLRVDEILSFSQADLLPDSVCVLDVASSIFIWIGKDASEGERKGSMEVANKYVEAAAKAKRLDAHVPISTIEAGAESAEFKSFFAGWEDTAHSASVDDILAKRLAELEEHRAAEAEKLLKAADSREARNAAAIAHLAEKRVAVAATVDHAAPMSWTRPLKHTEKKLV